MRTVRFAAYGGPEVLHVVEAGEPVAGPGEVRIAVLAAGVNAVDWKIRAGHLHDMLPLQLPAGIGADAAGVVDQVGPGVVGTSVGDTVFGSGRETYSEFAVLTCWAPVPEGMSTGEAAGLPVPVETAMRVLRQVGARPGGTLLVSGASGGVGSAVVQIAVGRGIEVIGTAGPDNQDYVRSLGATPTTYGPGLVDRVRSLAPDGIDTALDLAGSGVIPELVELTGDPGKVLSIADSGAVAHGAQVSFQSEDQDAALAEACRLFTDGTLSVRVARSYPFESAGAAHGHSASGHPGGRLILDVAGHRAVSSRPPVADASRVR